MRRLAAPLFILFLTALAFAQVQNPAAKTETPPPVEPAEPSGPATLGTPKATGESPTTPAAPETPAPAAEEAGNANALEIIVIASESMNEKWDGQSKLDALKDAMRKTIRYVPKNMDVGLRVSGHRVPATEAERSCQDSELMISPKAQGQSILLAEMGGIEAHGVHSVLQTLSRSLADLNEYKGQKNIILITDGAEDCVEQEPAAYLAADSLGRRGYHIYINGIGLTEDQSQGLAPLAKLTGGRLTSAADPVALQRDLVATLRQVSGEAPEEPPAAKAPSPTPPPAEEQAKAPPAEQGAESPIPVTPPPSGVKPEPKEPPFIGPAPMPFNPSEFMKTMIGEIKKILPKPAKPAPPPPPPPTPTFSATSLTIIVVESILLALALVGIVLLALKQYRQE